MVKRGFLAPSYLYTLGCWINLFLGVISEAVDCDMETEKGLVFTIALDLSIGDAGDSVTPPDFSDEVDSDGELSEDDPLGWFT